MYLPTQLRSNRAAIPWLGSYTMGGYKVSVYIATYTNPFVVYLNSPKLWVYSSQLDPLDLLIVVYSI